MNNMSFGQPLMYLAFILLYLLCLFVAVTGVTPSTGSIAGGSTLTISGEHFDNKTLNVKIAGKIKLKYFLL